MIRSMEHGRWLQRLSGRAPYESNEDMKNEHDPQPTPDETAAWLARAGSAVPADAWAAYKRLGNVERQPDRKMRTVLQRDDG